MRTVKGKEILSMKAPQLNRTFLNDKDRRIWELDFLRGIALILMIYFHTIYDLKEFYGYQMNYSDGLNFYIGKISAILFILISGISSSLSKSNANRGLKVLGIAMLITIITHLYAPDYGIKFGILHFLGISMLFTPVFIRLNKYLLIVIGVGILMIGNLVSGINTSANYLFPLGIIGNSFSSSDYYPLIPWLGVFLIGLSLSGFLYSERRRIFSFQMKGPGINIMGRNTLPVYLLHQPIILLILAFLH